MPPKGTPLSKEEVNLFVHLVAQNKIVNSKTTNHANNQKKEMAWVKITDEFNSSVSSCRRTAAQLRLKWENLKKAARKRTGNMRMSQYKTGGGKPEYFPPDEALDQVASILGATCDGYIAECGGDASASTAASTAATVDDGIDTTEPETEVVVEDSFNSTVETLGSEEDSAASTSVPIATYNSFNAARKRTATRQQKKREDVMASTMARNKAAEDFFKHKSNLLKLETEESRLRIEQYELQNKKLKLELEIAMKNLNHDKSL